MGHGTHAHRIATNQDVVGCHATGWLSEAILGRQLKCTETANKDGTWLREISSCCCLTTPGKTRQLLLNKSYIPFLPSLYVWQFKRAVQGVPPALILSPLSIVCSRRRLRVLPLLGSLPRSAPRLRLLQGRQSNASIIHSHSF